MLYFVGLLKYRLSIHSVTVRSYITNMFGQTISLIDMAKKKAAQQAVNDHVTTDMKLGIGSGSTIVFAVDRLVEVIKEKNLKVLCIPTSFQAEMLIVKNNLMLRNLDECPEIDCVIDGADEVDSNLSLIKGGGGCQTQEKILAFNSKKMVVIADFTKDSKYLGEKYKKGLPIEIIPSARTPISKKIVSLFGGQTELRMGKMKAGPVITDHGNLLLDWKFPDNISDWNKVNEVIKMIPGVVETGLFVNMVDSVYFGQENGTVKVVKGK